MGQTFRCHREKVTDILFSSLICNMVDFEYFYASSVLLLLHMLSNDFTEFYNFLFYSYVICW